MIQGETIDVPYEMTVSHSLRDFWQSAFYSHDRINTSTPFARSLGLQDQGTPTHSLIDCDIITHSLTP